MPGAELKEVVGENHWKALMHVKVGPIALQFDTDIERVEADDAARRVVLSARARELRGRGGATARIESSLAQGDSGTDVRIETDLNLQGTVAQYGRGVVTDVSAQLTSQFADCIAAKLTAEPAPFGDGAVQRQAAGGSSVPDAPKPIGGLRLGLRAIWRRLLSVFRRRR